MIFVMRANVLNFEFFNFAFYVEMDASERIQCVGFSTFSIKYDHIGRWELSTLISTQEKQK